MHNSKVLEGRKAINTKSTDEGINTMWHKHTKEFYLSMKKNGIMLFSGNSMKLDIVTVSEMRQIQKNIIFYLISRI